MAFFVWDFQIHEAEEVEKKMSMAGIFMMFGYLTVDSFTSNFQDGRSIKLLVLASGSY